MLGAIVGDIVGSVYEFESEKTKDFPLFSPNCRATDDSILTICVGLACAETGCKNEHEFKRAIINNMKEIARRYPDAGYGERFYKWLIGGCGKPYGATTNGAAMRVSPCAWAAETLEDAERSARWSAEITHNSSEGTRGAMSVSAAIFLAREGKSKEDIRKYIDEKYYDLDFTTDGIRQNYSYDMTCEGSVPQALVCFLDSTDFEDAIRNAVSLGGDGDTISAIAGSVAEAYYGVPVAIEEEAFGYLDEELAEYYYEYARYLYKWQQ